MRIEVPAEELPEDEHELDEFRGRLIEAAERWTRECMAERHVELSDV